jgi:hypothetical protein
MCKIKLGKKRKMKRNEKVVRNEENRLERRGKRKGTRRSRNESNK